MTTIGTSADPQPGPAGDFTDRPRELRTEDAFDVDAAHAWLRERVPDLPQEPPEVKQFPGGASNLTYLLTYPGDPSLLRQAQDSALRHALGAAPGRRQPVGGDSAGSGTDLTGSGADSTTAVGGRQLILRRPPTGTKAATAHDMAREFTIQQRLRPTFPQVPEVLALCTDPAVIGSEFYVMERVPGIILRGDLPPGMELTREQAAGLSRAMVDTIVSLHRVDPIAAGLADIGRGRGYVGRQVAGWSKRYRAARTENVPDFEAVMRWLDAEQPPDVGYCVVHGDFRLDNLVLDAEHGFAIKALLDWELATLGDPLMDLGSAMAYWVQADDDVGMQMARRQPSNLPGMFTRSEFVESYCAATGLDAGNWTFYEVFGLFRIAVIAQQIYYRFHHGQTTNPAFANFWRFVEYADERCRRIAGLA